MRKESVHAHVVYIYITQSPRCINSCLDSTAHPGSDLNQKDGVHTAVVLGVVRELSVFWDRQICTT